ncbi:MAG: CGNR zinc finger domain-containing protein [Chloroflexota bacterium]|nr:CGNR zinc finger domain-containing protein [Chloroflexota bacterium]
MLQKTFELTGGALCLDFTNTVGGSRERPREDLNGFGDLVKWGRQAGVLDGATARALVRRADAAPAEAAKALRRAISLREAIHRVFVGQGKGERPPQADVELIRRWDVDALEHSRLVAKDDGYEREWAQAPPAFDRVAWMVARDAVELLTSAELARVRECASETCAWLFLDTSRNRSRRWCDMRSCGNRAKVRRHYQRVRRFRSVRE